MRLLDLDDEAATVDEVARPHMHPMLGSPATLFARGRPPFLAYFPSAFERPVRPGAACLKEGFTIESNLRTAGIQQDLAQLKDDLGWRTLSGAAQLWWHDRENQRADHMPLLLRTIAEEAKRAGEIFTKDSRTPLA